MSRAGAAEPWLPRRRSIRSVWRERLLDRTVVAIAERVLALQDRVHLTRALVDDRRAGVAQKAFDGILGGIPIRAVDLDSVMRGVERRIRRVLLRHRNLSRVASARVLHPCDFEIQQAADLVIARHLSDHLLDQLVAPDLLAEGLSLARVFDRRVETRAHCARCTGGDGETPVVETAHRDLEAIALITDSVRLRHLEVGHEDRADVARTYAQSILDRLGAQRTAASLTVEHERGNAAPTRLGIGLGEDEQEVRGVGDGDPNLLPVQDVAVAVPARRRLHRRHTGPAVGPGQAVAGELLA